jgi:DNA replicative helicase MCM subunit Mcm2 (Cdc46/Mcm family)
MFDEKIIEPEINLEENHDVQVFEKHNSLIHGNTKRDILTTSFLKKYIYYVKKQIEPMLTEEATTYISQAWTKLRSTDDKEWADNYRAVPITVRALETLIRLSTAHAKLRLSKIVSKKDCEIAFEMVNFALYHETGKEDDQMEVDEEPKKGMIEDDESEGVNRSAKKIKKEEDDVEKVLSAAYVPSSAISSDQKKFVNRLFYRSKKDNMTSDEFWDIIKQDRDCEKNNIRSKNDLLNVVISLNQDGKLMYSANKDELVKL